MNIIFNRWLNAASLLFPIVVLGQSATNDSTFDNQHYRDRLEFFEAMPNQKDEIVFLGNSITEAGKWQEISQLKQVVNRGISGDVTYGILARLDEVLDGDPNKLFLLCGVNDMKRGIAIEVITANIERILLQVKKKSPHTKLYIQSILPVNEALLPASYSQVRNAKIHLLNKALKRLCIKYRVRFVDLHPVLADSKGELKAQLTIDGLHLRQAAYLIWVDFLKQQKLL
ncbi:GDSL-type esterase/lipase family protein [Sphingobacterium thalpophilum]|uniref:Arylesterase n=1 Tax=Sphingobacterium thalpophilum TaxID=259 RepID=A0A4U9V6K7_9SPHI|nr:GDSL-type esterase/lipase family protein [Sphingobacterium thalpophilum]VTR38241.1 Arylesterase precursor [Sphingobacterium thalpophilum]